MSAKTAGKSTTEKALSKATLREILTFADISCHNASDIIDFVQKFSNHVVDMHHAEWRHRQEIKDEVCGCWDCEGKCGSPNKALKEADDEAEETRVGGIEEYVEKGILLETVANHC